MWARSRSPRPSPATRSRPRAQRSSRTETTTLDFTLVYAPTTGDASGTVTDADTGDPVSGATVSLSGGPSTTTAANGTYTLSDVDAGSFSMSVAASGYDDWSGSVSITAGQTTTKNVALTPESAGVNLAVGRTFSASRYESSSYHPSKAGDGSTSTFWWSNDHGDDDDSEWIWVDLGAYYDVSRVEIVWYGSLWAEEYDVHVYQHRRWRRVAQEEDGDPGNERPHVLPADDPLCPRSCERTGTHDDNGYGIAELRVYE